VTLIVTYTHIKIIIFKINLNYWF